VTVSSSVGEDVVVSAGVSAGEKLVLDWPKSLADGAAVREIFTPKPPQ